MKDYDYTVHFVRRNVIFSFYYCGLTNEVTASCNSQKKRHCKERAGGERELLTDWHLCASSSHCQTIPVAGGTGCQRWVQKGGERRRYIASISTLDSGSHTLQSCRGPPVIYTATPQNLVISPEGSGGGRSVQAQSLSLVSCYRGFVSHGGIMNRSLSPRPSGTNPSPRFNRLDQRSASP